MTRYFYILYCPFNGQYVYEERQVCLQFTDMDHALKSESLREARRFRKRCENEGFPPLLIQKIKVAITVVAQYR